MGSNASRALRIQGDPRVSLKSRDAVKISAVVQSNALQPLPLAIGAFDVPGLLLAGSRMNEPRPRLPGPKVSFACFRVSTSRQHHRSWPAVKEALSGRQSAPSYFYRLTIEWISAI